MELNTVTGGRGPGATENSSLESGLAPALGPDPTAGDAPIVRITTEEALRWFKELAARELPRDRTTYEREDLDDFGMPVARPVEEFELNEEAAAAWVLEVGQALALCFPQGFELREQWRGAVKHAEGQPWVLSSEAVVTAARAAAQAAIRLLESDRLRSFADGVRAETVGEVLDQAEQLLDDGAKVPAAVLAGGALETHLRHLCDRAGLLGGLVGHGSIDKYKGLLDGARKAGNEVISKGDGKLVVAWADDRNTAAHDPTSFARAADEVRLMISGIRQLVARTE